MIATKEEALEATLKQIDAIDWTTSAVPEEVDMGTALHMLSLDKISHLRRQIIAAVALLGIGDNPGALQTLETVLAETDVGTMKEWLPGEEPF